MTDKVTNLAPQIWAQIEKSKRILLHCHPNPDGDSVGGVLAMSHLLRSLNKEVTIIGGDSRKSSTLSMLPGFDQIIEKSIDQINLLDFDTFIIQDSSNKDQISSKVVVDFPDSLSTIIIDHHKSNTSYAQINLVDTAYPAVCQVVYDLFKLWNIDITADMAACLLVGIYTDTGGYKYPPTDKNTLNAVADLVAIYPNFYDLLFQLENSNTPGRIKYLGLALQNIHTYFNNSVAMAEVSNELLTNAGLVREDGEKSSVSNYLISVIGWDLGISCYEPSPGETHISCRRRSDKYDLSILATALGGGGHPAAAGARMKLPLNQAKEFILKTISSVYPELGTP